ncbi:MAG: hypothetical protein KAS32_21110, partial [Candidatus Peribacteraceae bacterium]|nr:hypothetical protein [Candidatus Peribacteraceae bacterium]
KLYLLASKSMDKLATEVNRKAMLGEPIVAKYTEVDPETGDKIVKYNTMLPTFRDARASSQEVKARTEPIQAQAIARESKTYIQVNLNDYNNKELAQDVVVEAIEDNGTVS